MPTPIEDRYQDFLPVLNLGEPVGPEQSLDDGGSLHVTSLNLLR
jgi:hypothetical protein